MADDVDLGEMSVMKLWDGYLVQSPCVCVRLSLWEHNGNKCSHCVCNAGFYATFILYFVFTAF